MKKCILLLGFPDSLLRSLSGLLSISGYQVMNDFNPSIAGWLVAQRRFALIVVNIEYFRSGLFELLDKVREHQQAPIVALSDKMSLTMSGSHIDVDLILPLQQHPRKMMAYLIALMKRYQGDTSFIAPRPLDGWPIEQGDFFVDQLLGWARIKERSVDLSPKESRLLVYFLLRTGQTLNPQTVCTALWMNMGGYGCDERTVVEELRNKIELDPEHPVYLQDSPCGYRFFDTAPSEIYK